MSASTPNNARRAASKAARKALRLALGPQSPLRKALPDPVKTQLRVVRRHLPAAAVRIVDSSTGKTPAAPIDPAVLAAASRRPFLPNEPVRVWVAPANFAGQGKAWADAMETHITGVGARSMAVKGAIRFPVDQEVAPEAYRDIGWQKEQEKYVFAHYTHALIEAERPLFGTRYGNTCEIEIKRLTEAGLAVALISHGSDLRVPSKHAQMFPHSPFDDPEDRTYQILEKRALNNARIIEQFDGPVFVSTPDLIDYAPRAHWCPTVIDTYHWDSDWPLLARPIPRVVHIPSNGKLKGSDFIDEICTQLAEEGHIEYRTPRGVSHADIQREFSEADIVIDQLVMGLYGVTAIEGLAAGRVVVAFLGDVVRQRVKEVSGLDIPIKEATVETLREVLLDIITNRDSARAFAAKGPDCVAEIHDGRLSAKVLSEHFTGGKIATATDALAEREAEPVAPFKPVPDLTAARRVFIGPANLAGQGTAWARALRTHLDGVSATSMATRGHLLRFPSDYQIDPTFFSDESWSERQERYLSEFYTHILIEALRPVTGFRHGTRATGEIPVLREAGLNVALIAHGADVRVPSLHRKEHAWSPYGEIWDGVPSLEVLEQRAQRTIEAMTQFCGHTFVSTPDLLDYVPQARWCPIVVDVDSWQSEEQNPHEGVMRVMHAPSHSLLQGTMLIEPAVTDLAHEGVITYSNVGGTAPSRMRARYAAADVVLDQFALGTYGVTACEAMAAGRVVVGHVTEKTREQITADTGLELPIVEAEPDQIEQVLRNLAEDPQRRIALSRAGQEFVRAVHDGTKSANVLATWID
ncbi:glycosyltransferase [Dermatophilus congolensis]|uniref:glycosyltransferase n=1 Tax=Dermatophilus congolensis TaxID=1863 RepID=UPI001AB04A5C|nr:glycosyltransferase [Dermatophilus congolensis]MBO3180887.1 glycosyltransferase family 4 protein [Dermatophilus congolensis]MBO3207913.1 glycosyltransferase family 4 protein [Dermatophilus congolensis]